MANIAANKNPDLPWYDGDRINEKLAGFNHWKDDFFIELAPIMLMIGFITGTIDVLTSGSIESVPAISVVWAVVQAISIDGLFFAVWGRIRRFEWSKKSWFPGVVLVLVGILLAIVAALVNNILSYEELNHVSGIASVMVKLGIDAGMFSYGRSILVVIVALLVALFTKGRGLSVKNLQATVDRLTEEVDGLRSTRESLSVDYAGLQDRYMKLESQSTVDQATLVQISEEKSTLAQNVQQLEETVARLRKRSQTPKAIAQPTQKALPAPAQEKETGYVARDDGETISVTNGLETVYATGSYREQIKEAMLRMVQENKEVHYPTIAQDLSIGLSTVKKYGPKLKEEIAREVTGGIPVVRSTVDPVDYEQQSTIGHSEASCTAIE